jgi:transcriptional antiterminator RfaH
MMTRWYVVQTQPQAEAKAGWHLANQGFKCFLPRVVALRRHARRVEPVLAPLFPRYLFANLNLDTTGWRAINGTRGVVGLLTDGARPLAVPAGVVESLIVKSDSRGAVPLAALGVFTKGTNVRIRAGTYAGQMGVVTEIPPAGSDRVLILLSLLGAEAELQVPSYAIEAA